MVFTPKWIKLLPSHLRPENKNKVRKLERLRRQLGIPDRGFAMIMMPSIDKAKMISPLLLEATNRQHSTILEQIESAGTKLDENGPEATSILYEILYFYLHLTDRLSNEYLGIEREEFMDNLFKDIIEGLSGFFDTATAKKEFAAFFTEEYNKRQTFYGQFRKFLAGKDEGLKDTLFWEYGQMVARYVPKREHDAYIISIALGLAELFFKTLRDFLQYHEAVRFVKEITGEMP